MIIQLAMDLPDDPLSVPLCRRALRTILRELGVEEMRAYEIELALGEAAANVIRHAYHRSGNQYRVELEFYSDTVRLCVIDHGRGFDRSSLRLPGEDEASGRGILLIEQIADAAWVEIPEAGGTRITAEFKLDTALRNGSAERDPQNGASISQKAPMAPRYTEESRLSHAPLPGSITRNPPTAAPPA